MLGIGSRERCRVWVNNTGTGHGLHGGIVRFGLLGSADIIGVGAGGRFIALEVKTGKARQSKQQENFALMITKFGGLYAVVRSVQDAVDVLDQAGC